MSWAESFVLTFVPLFIVIDALGNLPMIITMSEGMSSQQRRITIHIATATAAIVGLAFLFFGRFILNVMGISPGAFAIAGGTILFVLSIKYILTGRVVELVKVEMMAVVPIGTPLVVGPATITTLLLLVPQHPLYIVLASFLLNLLIVWAVFLLGNWIVGFTGKGGLRAVSQVFNLLLAAIGISMILKGLTLLQILHA